MAYQRVVSVRSGMVLCTLVEGNSCGVVERFW